LIILNLALAEFFWSFFNLVLAVVNLTTKYEQRRSFDCIYRGSFQIFAGASISWSVGFAIYILAEFTLRFQNTKSLFKFLVVFCWLIPVAIELVFVLRSENSLLCHPDMNLHMFLWGGFILLSFAFNTFSYIMTICKYYDTIKKNPNIANLPSLKKVRLPLRLSLYILVFLFSFSPNVTNTIISYIRGHYCTGDTFILILEIFNDLSGTFNCIVYGFISKSLRRNYTKSSGIIYFLLSPILLIPIIIWRISRKIQEKKMKRFGCEFQPISTKEDDIYDE
jgi:hypothetical protein